MEETDDHDTMDLAGAAKYLRLGYEATKKLFHAGQLPGLSLNQKHTVFLREDLARWLHDRAREQAEARRQAMQHQDSLNQRPHRRRGAPLPDLDAWELIAKTTPTPGERHGLVRAPRTRR